MTFIITECHPTNRRNGSAWIAKQNAVPKHPKRMASLSLNLGGGESAKTADRTELQKMEIFMNLS